MEVFNEEGRKKEREETDLSEGLRWNMMNESEEKNMEKGGRKEGLKKTVEDDRRI